MKCFPVPLLYISASAPGQGHMRLPMGQHSGHRVPHRNLGSHVEVGVMSELEGQHICRVVNQNVLPHVTGFGEIPPRKRRQASFSETKKDVSKNLRNHMREHGTFLREPLATVYSSKILIQPSVVTLLPVAAWLWSLPTWEELYGLDMEPLSGREVLAVGQVHGPPHSTGQTLVQTGGACCSNQLEARTDHVAHHYGEKQNQWWF